MDVFLSLDTISCGVEQLWLAHGAAAAGNWQGCIPDHLVWTDHGHPPESGPWN